MKLNEPEFIDSAKTEFTIKKCTTPLLLKNFKSLFPNELKALIDQNGDENIGCLNDDNKTPLYLILCWRQTKLPMSGFSSATDEEREEKSLFFIETASNFCNIVKENGYWSDFIDPLSGVPYINRDNANSVFVPTDSVQMMGIDIIDVGCCQVMIHPTWKVRSFFSIMISTAPFEIIDNSLHQINN
ncbi:hypothetical protein DICPUDRAFT_43706 [Dictyostelium purpureum]|uniref:Methylmalonic aciduria and homocystinuria type D protein n=1 Tax=Dictyostelium purpureum TaxID=5786 RepID=F1A4M1_DICPU|nr:uncharacterized protein DICPUDRAFT_43706 [Dictyostelium purpureum]EGC28855.1 hypothetical protein DICPUDRAFT_43706 [Dictyostelium purpureum]|eukprot:XP_003294615.1 hypothetical protein DICPUDRAFT_43706 [Dictyostelium purpureum]